MVLGLPIVPSSGNLDFWLRLCGACCYTRGQRAGDKFREQWECLVCCDGWGPCSLPGCNLQPQPRAWSPTHTPTAGVRGLPEAAAVLRSFPQAEEAGDKAAHAAAVRQWNADLIRRVGGGPGGA